MERESCFFAVDQGVILSQHTRGQSNSTRTTTRICYPRFNQAEIRTGKCFLPNVRSDVIPCTLGDSTFRSQICRAYSLCAFFRCPVRRRLKVTLPSTSECGRACTRSPSFASLRLCGSIIWIAPCIEVQLLGLPAAPALGSTLLSAMPSPRFLVFLRHPVIRTGGQSRPGGLVHEQFGRAWRASRRQRPMPARKTPIFPNCGCQSLNHNIIISMVLDGALARFTP